MSWWWEPIGAEPDFDPGWGWDLYFLQVGGVEAIATGREDLLNHLQPLQQAVRAYRKMTRLLPKALFRLFNVKTGETIRATKASRSGRGLVRTPPINDLMRLVEL